MKLLKDNKGLLTPPSESDNTSSTMSAPSVNIAGGGDELAYRANKSFLKDKSFHDEFQECLDLNTWEVIYLDFQEAGHSSFVLEGINKLRKQGQFCDITLVVDDHEIQVHRAVLAACSSYLFDFFSSLEESTEPQPTYKLKHVMYVGFQYLLDYMYTGRLHVPLENVPAVYATSLLLKMDSATKICASFLSQHLTPANCLGTWEYIYLLFSSLIERIVKIETRPTYNITIAVCYSHPVILFLLFRIFVCVYNVLTTQ